jgi:hypothetical protein
MAELKSLSGMGTSVPKARQSTAAAAKVTKVIFSWQVIDQSATASGTPLSAGDAGEMAVRRYGRAMKRLSDK